MNGSMDRQAFNAQSIREYIRTRYVEPARQRHLTLLTLRAGDIHRELGLRNRVPNVCQVMESKLLEKEAGVKISSRQGPPSGRGTTLTVTYAVNLQGPEQATAQTVKPNADLRRAEHSGAALFYALRGMGAELYAAEGGGEAWLTQERSDFYGEGKKELK